MHCRQPMHCVASKRMVLCLPSRSVAVGINVPYFLLIGLTPLHESVKIKLCQHFFKRTTVCSCLCQLCGPNVGGSLVKLAVFHKRGRNLRARLLDRRKRRVISLGVVKKRRQHQCCTWLGWKSWKRSTRLLTRSIPRCSCGTSPRMSS